MKRARLCTADFTVGWICALPVERAAAEQLLDERYEDTQHWYDGPFVTGRMGKHNVVIGCLPAGAMGTTAAAVFATQMEAVFPRLQARLMVGVGGGVPSAEADVRLGDVVISQPNNGHGGVIQYDFGKAGVNGQFKRTGFLAAPPEPLLHALANLRAREFRRVGQTWNHLRAFDTLPGFTSEGTGPDLLFQAESQHVQGSSCENCDYEMIVHRCLRQSRDPTIHCGTIASGNQVIKDGVTRDQRSAELGGVLCFEMEAAGLVNHFPCLVVRGICDYADSHKNDSWQPYAAATAAACGKEIMTCLREVKPTAPARGISNESCGVLLDLGKRVDELMNYMQTIVSNLSSTVGHAAPQRHSNQERSVPDQPPQLQPREDYANDVRAGKDDLAQIEGLLILINQKLDRLGSRANSADDVDNSSRTHMKSNRTGHPEFCPGFRSQASRFEGNSTALSRCLYRLEELEEKKDRLGFVRDAEQILDDLSLLIHAAIESEVPIQNAGSASNLSYQLDQQQKDAKEIKLKQQVNRLLHCLALSKSINVHSTGNIFQLVSSDMSSDATFASQRSTLAFTKMTERAQILVLCKTIRRVYRRGKNTESEYGAEDCRTVYWKTIITPLQNALRSRISIVFRQTIHAGGTQLSIPSLTFHATRPKSCYIFESIQFDPLESIIDILQSGEASITDCDSNGSSLCRYAVRAGRPDVCKYLIEHGLDVDAIENNISHLVEIQFRLTEIYIGDDDRPRAWCPTETSMLETLQILLEAGADPLIPCVGGFRDQRLLFHESVYGGFLAKYLPFFMRFSADMLDPHERNLGYTPFLAACRSSFDLFGHKIEAMRLLLAHGADAKATCSNFGNTAAHLILLSAQDKVDCGQNYLEATQTSLQTALELALQSGALFQAPNEIGEVGMTPGELAFHLGLHSIWSRALESVHPNAKDPVLPAWRTRRSIRRCTRFLLDFEHCDNWHCRPGSCEDVFSDCGFWHENHDMWIREDTGYLMRLPVVLEEEDDMMSWLQVRGVEFS